jgi:predicted component of type VI protein secretion system
MPFISLFARYVQPSQGLITYFSERFGLESAELNQCVLRQALIPAEQRCRLGGPETQHRQLGQGALLGSQVRDLRGKFQILLPVSDLKLFQRLMPGGGLRRDLEEAVNRYLIEPLLYELVLRLSPGTASGVVLGRGHFRRLGLSAFLSPRDDREITIISRAVSELNFEEGIEEDYAAA